MKKLLVFLTALTIMLSFSLAGSALIADLNEVDEMNVFILEDFEGLSGTPGMEWTHRGNFTAEYTDGKLVIKENLMFEDGYGYAKFDLVRNSPATVDGITGFGLYMENNTTVEIVTRAYWVGCDNFIGYVDMPYYTLVDGVLTEHYAGSENAEIYLAPGFKGYLIFPWETMNLGQWYGSDPMEVTYSASRDWVSIAISGWSSEDGNVVIDDLLLYGSSEMGGTTMQFTHGQETPTQEPIEAPTETPTEAPSEPIATTEATPAPTENVTSQPSDVPTDIATPDGDNTGLIIGIVAAVVVVVAVVVIVLLGKKKSAK